MGRLARLAAITALAAGSTVITACRDKVEELRLEDAEALDAAAEAASLDLAEDLGVEEISEDPAAEPEKKKKKKSKKHKWKRGKGGKKQSGEMWDVLCE